LAANFGGSVLVREQKRQLYPEGAYYRVELLPANAVMASEWLHFKVRGRVDVSAKPAPRLLPFFNNAALVLIREAGF
jgi:hypothetical protein